jgi:hypothetical protein
MEPWVGKVIMASTEKFSTTVARRDIDELPYYSFFEGKITGQKIRMLGIQFQNPEPGDTLLSAISHVQKKYAGVFVDADIGLICYTNEYYRVSIANRLNSKGSPTSLNHCFSII